MALRQYKTKRSFGKTPEPTGGKSGGGSLRFVIQKHDASHLHYDFRLEMGGVLKSWAVPKGPSTDPSVRRLAMQVEDHPYDYKDFEGIIPRGNYGAGTVLLWDEGVYHPIGGKGGKQAEEKKLLAQLKEGSLKFVLEGSKLRGEYALVRAPGMGDNAWLLIKHKDAYQSKKDVTRQDKSVRTARTLRGIERDAPASGGGSAKRKPAAAASATKHRTKADKLPAAASPRRPSAASVKKWLKEGRPAPFPRRLSPMLATLVDGPFDEPGWSYEVKWDGYRALGFMNKGKVTLRSRNDKSFAEKFYPVYEALKRWNIPAVVDGEIVVVDDKGVSSFEALQQWRSEADGLLRYYVFDILWYDGGNLMALPLPARRTILSAVLPKADETILLSENFEATAGEFLEAARKLGLEGIMAKRQASPYTPGTRTRDWLKMKAARRQEVVIGGYTRNEGSSKPFSSLLAGVFDKGRFVYTGKVGTGFSQKAQREMLKRFKPLVTRQSPFTHPPEVDKPSRFRPDPPHAAVVWLRPELVAEVSFTELTRDGLMRHPSFKGLREDKPAGKVVLEKAVPADKALKEAETGSMQKVRASGSPQRISRAVTPPSRPAKLGTLLNPSEKMQVRKVDSHEIKFTNLDKVFWPREKITKRDLINYYYQVAPVMLPYLRDRPQSLNRYPGGIGGKHFYQKDVTGKVPSWIKTYRYHAEGETEDKHFLVADGLASLLYMATMGCIEINPWSSTTRKPDHPTWCIIDLDPGRKSSFDDVIEAANATHRVLEAAGVACYPKTSGATGMHVYIPLGGRYTYEQSKEFARVVVTLVHEQLPRSTTLERSLSKRGGKMYLDFLQNRPQATIAAPYSLRPREGATVSMPLDWDEVAPGLKPEQFTIFNAAERISDRGDLFNPVLGKGISLAKVIRQWQQH